MPYRPEAYTQIKSALDSGFLTEEEIDERVLKVLELIEKTQNDKKVVTTTKAQRHQNAKTIAEDIEKIKIIVFKKMLTFFMVKAIWYLVSKSATLFFDFNPKSNGSIIAHKQTIIQSI